MSLINTEIKPFKATAYHHGEFVQMTHEDLKGKWSVFVFYPADFTFVCPTELGDLADHYAAFKRLGRRDLRRLDRHPFYPQGVARHLRHHRKVQYPLIGDPTQTLARNFGVLIEEEGLAYRGTFVIDPAGTHQDHRDQRQRHRPRCEGAAAQGAGGAVRRLASG